VFVDGSVYEGTFKNDLREGHGTMVYEDGTKYVGEWRNNWRDGEFGRARLTTYAWMVTES
jgi:hypothetical protein